MALLILPPTEIIIFGIKLTFIQFSLAFYRNNFHLYLSTTSVSQSAHSTSMIQFTTTSSKSNPSTTVSKMPILWFNTRSVHDDHTKQLLFLENCHKVKPHYKTLFKLRSKKLLYSFVVFTFSKKHRFNKIVNIELTSVELSTFLTQFVHD